MIEPGVKTVEGQIRVLKSAIDEHYNMSIPGNHPIMSWLVIHASTLITNYGIGRDGQTPYKLLTGRDSTRCMFEFGECIQYKPLGLDKHRYKLEPQLFDGIWLGINARNGEYFIGTNTGVKKARDIYRVSEGERYNVDMLNGFKGVPWKMIPDAEEDELILEVIDAGLAIEGTPNAGKAMHEQARRRAA